MTNDGDADRKAYLERITAAPEEVRFIKLADAIENTTSVSYAVPTWASIGCKGSFCRSRPNCTIRSAGASSRSTRVRHRLQLMFDFRFQRLEQTVVMYTGTPKRRGGPPPTDITEEEWAEDLYGDGPIVQVPTPDE